MVAKFLTFFGLVAAATAVAVPVAPAAYQTAIPVAHAPAKLVYAQPEAPAQYDFSYSVHDNLSGDVKQQQESRSGDAVHGSYSLVQPDGVHRIVEYTADEHQGFNAVVRYEGAPTQQHAKIAVAAAPVYAHAAPVAKVAYAPAPVAKIAYAPAPVAKITYAQAPVAKVAYAQAPVSYAAPAPVAYAPAPAQVTYSHAPAQVTYSHAPAQIHYAQAPIAKVAYAQAPVAKVAYTHNLGQVSFSSPAVSYHH